MRTLQLLKNYTCSFFIELAPGYALQPVSWFAHDSLLLVKTWHLAQKKLDWCLWNQQLHYNLCTLYDARKLCQSLDILFVAKENLWDQGTICDKDDKIDDFF